MWRCPKCGREFKNQNQEHFCGEKPKTIDEYISIQPENVQQILYQVRDVIHAVIPEAFYIGEGIQAISLFHMARKLFPRNHKHLYTPF